MQDKFLSAIGLARRSGKAVYGTEQVRNLAKAGKARLIILASDASESTKKEIIDTASFYNADYVSLNYTMAELSSASGLFRNISSIAITDENIATLVKNSISTKM